MFILDLIPDDIIILAFGGLISIGVIGIIIDYAIYYIPVMLPYRIIIKIISILLLGGGMFIAGAYMTDIIWKERVAEVQKQLAIAEAKSQEVNTVIKEKLVEKLKIVEKKVIINHNIIQKKKEIINAECKIPDIAFKIYNTSVLGNSYE